MLVCFVGLKLEEFFTLVFSKVESLSLLIFLNDIIGFFGFRMVEVDTISGIKDFELVDSGVDEEFEFFDEEVVFFDLDEDDESDTVFMK